MTFPPSELTLLRSNLNFRSTSLDDFTGVLKPPLPNPGSAQVPFVSTQPFTTKSCPELPYTYRPEETTPKANKAETFSFAKDFSPGQQTSIQKRGPFRPLLESLYPV